MNESKNNYQAILRILRQNFLIICQECKELKATIIHHQDRNLVLECAKMENRAMSGFIRNTVKEKVDRLLKEVDTHGN